MHLTFQNCVENFCILVLSPDLSTVRKFLLKQTQLKCLTFGRLEERTKDMFDTVKVLKCYSGIST